MSLESDLHRLSDAHAPSAGAQARVRETMLRKMAVPAMLAEAKQAVTPDTRAKQAVWSRITDAIAHPHAHDALSAVRQVLSPTTQQKRLVRLSLLERLLPRPQPLRHSLLKWGAAFAVFALLIRLSPALLLTSRSIADSVVLVTPTRGASAMLAQDGWQAIAADTTVAEPSSVRTDDGEVTILLHDDGSVRADTHTEFAINDLTDRPANGLDPTITLKSGRLWIQGFVPSHLRPITIATPGGKIAIHEGSVSVDVSGSATTVRVWDRHASINDGRADHVILVAGEWAQIRNGIVSPVSRSLAQDEEAPWVTQNLKRDAVHRREIAQRQAERRAARAGILPNSPFYVVKRAAEKVDVLLTFDEESRVQKRLDQASRRVDEAVGLIASGETDTTAPLEEFRETLLAVASDTGSTVAAASLIRQQVSENAAILSAARPDDVVYAVKVAVLEASTELPETSTDLKEADVNATLISDSIDTITAAVESGDVEKAAQVYEELKPEIETLASDASLEPAIKKDVLAALQEAEESLQQETEPATVVASAAASDSSAASSSSAPARRVPSVPEEKLLTPEERNAVALGVFNRVALFDEQPRPRLNELVYGMKMIEQDYPKQALQILSQLHRMFPKNDMNNALLTALRGEIQKLREKE